jgi:hypothetical protein
MFTRQAFVCVGLVFRICYTENIGRSELHFFLFFCHPLHSLGLIRVLDAHRGVCGRISTMCWRRLRINICNPWKYNFVVMYNSTLGKRACFFSIARSRLWLLTVYFDVKWTVELKPRFLSCLLSSSSSSYYYYIYKRMCVCACVCVCVCVCVCIFKINSLTP